MFLCGCLALSLALLLHVASPEPCQLSNGCPNLSSHSLNLSSLRGVWETAFFTRPEGSLVDNVPSFFNISVCGSVPAQRTSQCSDSSICYSEHQDTFYSLGSSGSCDVSYANRQVQFVFEYSQGAANIFGQGNVTVTLVCGRNLGVPEVIAGDPNSHAIEILWITSAACKTDPSHSATNESKCYYIHAYEDQGIKAKLVDLTNLIRPGGYEATYAERGAARFVISVCRPMEGTNTSACNGAMACLVTQPSPGFNIHQDVPLALGFRRDESNLHMDGDLLTAVYSSEVASCENHKRLVKVHFLCPSGIQAVGPTIGFLDDSLCLIVVNWYTSYACGTGAIQSHGCQLTTSGGVAFDLSGLAPKVEISSVSGGHTYLYNLQICSGNSLNEHCNGRPPSPAVRVSQTDPADSGVCYSLGVGDGKLRYADGSLTLTYTLGDTCHSNFARTSVISFVCPESTGNASNTTELSFVGEDNCFYEFEWITPLACGATTSGASDCQFELGGSKYNFAPLVGRDDKNWVAIDDDNNTACFMINPCGDLEVTEDKLSAGTKYCNQKTAPYACLGSSVCQVFNSGTGVPVGKFNLKDLSTLTSIDSNVLTVQGRMDKNHSAMIHYVCKTGDLDTPPVFINVTNGEFYEFHWTTFAACPLGVTVGDGCMVTQETTGFVFNLSSLSATEYDFQGHSKGDLQDHSATYRYQIAVCAALNTTQCPTNTAVCQVGQKSSKSAGNFNTSLVYADGTLKLHYNGGTSCSHYPHRNSTILFECDSVAHTPFVDSVTEVDYCQYVVEMRTKLACPPAYRITECVHIDDDGHSYDFSELSKTTGNWQASGPDGSIYYINVCHPLNRRAGCSPLSAVCKEKTTSGRTAYSDLGLASTSNFTVVHRSSQKDRVVLRYNFTRSDAQPGECEVVETLIELVCSSTITVERGPRFVSGGDEDNHCQYTFIWETRGACPVHTAREEMSCTVTDSSSGYTFDLSPLHSNRSYFLVNSDTNGGPTWNVTLCGALNSTCSNTREDVGTVPVCQYTSDSRAYVCGSLSTQTLQYLDRSLSLRYTGGDLCHHSGRNRSVLINFECDNSVYIGEPRYVREDNCDYTFEWPTVLACLPRELECVAEGEKYDLRALLEIRNWEVNVGGDSRYHYVIGGCRSLNQGQLPHCPAKGGMGACRYSSDGSEGGRVLGYVTSDLVEERSGRLRLSYYNGDRCANGRKSAVHVYFQCAAGGGAGVPHLQEDSDDSCETTIEWLTQYACPLDATATNSWVINNTVTHQVFNLTKLSPTLSSVYVEQDGTRYNYTVSLAGHTVGACGSHNDNVGACQVKVGTSEAHLLGRVNNTLQLLGEELRVEYTNGSVCTHVHKPRKAVITFECDSREFLQVLPEADCEYSFVVHTDLACAQTSAISVECSVDGFDDLQVFLSLKSSPIVLSNTSAARAFISVCDPISRDNQENSTALRCPSGAAACIVDTDRKIHLGKPTPRLPPTALSGGEGVILNYTQGDICNSATGQRYQTALLLVCNRNKPVGAPELISYTACEYIFRWESIHACRLTLPSTPVSKTVCNITDPVSHSTYDFRTLVQQEHFVINKTNSNTRYHLKLCGSASSPPTGCDANTGICVTDSNGGNPKTILYADHKISITSRLPYEFEIIYPSGVRCGSDSSKKWTAFVTLQCDARGGTQQPEFVSDDHCELQLQWRNSSFCLGDRACVATDPHTRFIFNLDGLYSQTWTGLVADWNTKGAQSRDKGGTFTLGFCRNLNPFSSVGRHCSSPSGICWHLPGGNQHLNLGHMTTAPKVGYNNGSSIIHLVYSGGDRCDSDPTKKYHTDIFLTCGEEHSTPLLWNHHDCSFGITMETPVACRPGKTNSTSCILSQSIGTYNFNPLAHNITFMDSTTSTPYKVCLCPNSPFCPTAGIWQGGTSLGTFQRMTATGSLGGPRVLFLHGDNCGGDHVSYQSTIFMECNRSADPSRGTFALQRTLSRGCQKYFFWSTPYACLSEQISCLLSVESDSSFYDFNPLYSRSQPWRVNGANSRDQFMINICGPIRNGTGNNKCSPESSVCVRRSSGQYDDVGTADTQQMITTAGGHVQIMFSGAGQCQGGKSHTTINMVCGIQGLRALPPPDSCHYEFEWHTPYACKEEDQPETVSLCQDKVRASDNFFFYPKRLHSSTDYTVNDTDSTYYLNLCGPAASCGSSNGDVSVCSRKPSESSIVTTIASYKQQHILADGYWMRFQMDLTPGKRHAIVLVQCLTGDSISQPAAESIEFQNHVQTKDAHHYYYFQLYTKKGCSFEPPTTAPSPTHGGGSQDTGGGSSQSSGGKAAGVIITVLVIVAVVAIVAACILYKRERRQYAMSLIIKVCGSKASEPVRYHKLPTRSRDEEIALLEEESEEEYEKGEGEGEGEGKGKGGGEKEASDGTNTDDELLNL